MVSTPGRDYAVTFATVITICFLAAPLQLGVARGRILLCLLRVCPQVLHIPQYLLNSRRSLLVNRMRIGLSVRRPVRDIFRSRRNRVWVIPSRRQGVSRIWPASSGLIATIVPLNGLGTPSRSLHRARAI